MNRKAQVWVETVVYTLIAFVLIGAVLTFAKPKIEQMQDEAIIEQSLNMIKSIDSEIFSIKGVSGNIRILDVTIKKGTLKIDAVNDKIIFEIESRKEYSQPGSEIQKDNVAILTEKKGEYNLITLKIDYSDRYQIRYNQKDELKSLSKAATPYKLSIENSGTDDISKKPIINFEVK